MSLLRLHRALPSASSLLRRTFLTTSCLHSEAEPIVLPRLKEDLKTAMRSKDKPRLAVLRSMLAEITNASKTPRPITTDAHLMSLLLKQIAASQKAVAEFESVKRDDLVEKEKGQIAVLGEYVDGIPRVGKQEIEEMVGRVVEEVRVKGGKLQLGPVMGKMMGEIQGRPVDTEEAKKIVEKAIEEK
ncbi:GatB/YqeY domain-containing protein [Zopfia rhizophila CBS 207.26]|uniref:Altered inheritance of mitochondria protein 41 n=1 Tax=Zopfia rhizophila CBS 207.26 TaxID=1314779 RepID=A0A6A6ECF4_9PEZI|nr:GatB/YqeY domain-containing protein [Zopfia rhizophila CBS 207.26]